MIEFSTADPRFDPKGSVVVNGYLFVAAAGTKARRSDPDTSHEAANYIAPALRELQLKVLMWAQRRPLFRFTDAELQRAMGGNSTYRTRRAELVQLGLVRDTGEREHVPGHKTRFAVWELTDAGREYGLRLY